MHENYFHSFETKTCSVFLIIMLVELAIYSIKIFDQVKLQIFVKIFIY